MKNKKKQLATTKGNLKPTQFKALIKTLKQHYEFVTVEEEGEIELLLVVEVWI